MSVEELQSAVAQLSAEELDRFSRWLEEFQAGQWDQRIEADILAGHLDTAGRRAAGEFEAGRCTPLPLEPIRHSGVQELSRKRRIEELKSLLGSVHLDLDIPKSRRRP